jgi:pimeloyl-ACP methyl ester carboxylesterase
VFDGCFGWIHEGSRPRGVVLCSAFAFEGVAAHRAWRDLADRLADAGLPTLRFDWAGTGDGLGDDRDPDRLAAWEASLVAAIERLKEETDVAEVVLVGLRLGATLAARVAAARDDVALVVASGPVVSGRLLMREQQSFARMLRVRADDDPPDADEIGGHALNGFFVSEETAEAIRAIDLRKTEARPAPRVMVLCRDADVAADEWAARLRHLGATVETAPFPELDNLIENPTRSRIPAARWEAIVAAALVGAGAPRPALPVPIEEAPRLEGDDWIEEPLRFGRDDRLFGIVSRPRRATSRRPAIVLLDAGRVSHVGWGRGAVELARRLAGAGHVVLRMDPAGIGDSDAMPDGPDEVLYSREAVDDPIAAFDRLEGEAPAGFVVVGTCSGAHFAWHAAIRDARVVGVALINLQRFVWKEGDSLEIAMRNQMRSTGAYRAMALRADTWKRLLTGQIHVVAITRELGRRILGRIVGKVTRFVVTDPAVRGLKALAARGVRVLFVFGEDDGGRDEFAAHVGKEASIGGIAPTASVEIHTRADHNFSQRDPRRKLHARLVAFLDEVARR